MLKPGIDKGAVMPDVSHPSDPFQRRFETLLCGDQELG